MVNKAYKFRIYPTKIQTELIHKTFGCARLVYNKMLYERKEHYKKHGVKLSENTGYKKFKDEYEFLSEVDSQALAQEWTNLNKTYNSFFKGKGKVGFPKFKSKKNDKKSYTTCVSNKQNPAQRFEDGYLRLPKLGKLKIKQHREIPDYYILKAVTVSQSASGKYYASVLFEYDFNVQEHKLDNVIGLDFSMSQLYLDSEGNKPNFPRFYRRGLEKLARMQRKLSKMKKFSSNYYRQKRKVARYHEYISSCRKDFLHKQSRQIINVYDGVAIENLNMKDMSRALKFGKSVHDNGWGMFVSFLDYKLKEQGKHLIKVDKWFASSKTCSTCGTVNKELTISDRVYICACGNSLDRDVNAAINIKNEGIRLLNLA